MQCLNASLVSSINIQKIEKVKLISRITIIPYHDAVKIDISYAVISK